MSSKMIRIACKAPDRLGLALLTPLQGELKTLSQEDYERLRSQIVNDGFSFPIAVWENAADAQIYIIDGHQRAETLRRMQKEGFKVPELPVFFIEADSMEQAKRKLLSAASQYGVVNEAGLAEFLKDTAMNSEQLISGFRFPEVDLFEFGETYLSPVENFSGPISIGDDSPLPSAPLDGVGQARERVVAAVGETELPPEAAQPSAAPLESQVRMVQLFFNGETQPEFLMKCAKLQQKLKTVNLTDTVMEVVRASFERLGAD